VGSRSEDPKLIIRVIIFELVEPSYMPTVRQRHGRTDGRTDGRTTYNSNTPLALRASRGKNLFAAGSAEKVGRYTCITLYIGLQL